MPGLVSTSVIDLFKDKAIYIAGGHIHSYTTYPKEKPYFFVSGSLEFSNVKNESSDKKGFIIFDTDNNNHEFIEVEHRKRIKVKFDYNNIDEIENEFETFIKNLNLTGEEILLISTYIKNGEYFNKEKLEDIAEKNGILKVDIELKSIVSKENNKINEMTENMGVSDMEKNIINNWKNENLGESDKERLIDKFSKLKEYVLNDEVDKTEKKGKAKKENELNPYLEGFLELFDKVLEGE